MGNGQLCGTFVRIGGEAVRLRRILAGMLAGVVCFLLTGCERMLNRSLYVAKPHMEQTYRDATDSVEISNYAMLLKVLREWMRGGIEEGTLRFSHYEGNADIDTAVDEACAELLYDDAYGRYVEAYISPVSTTDINGKLVTIRIRYRRDRPPEEIAALLSVSNEAALHSLLRAALREYTTYLALELLYPAGDEADPAELIERIYLQQPLYALGLPRVTGTVYRGERGASSILELRLEYAEDAETRMDQLERVRGQVEALVGRTQTELPPELQSEPVELSAWLFTLIRETIAYDYAEAYDAAIQGTDRLKAPYSMIGAMLEHTAVSEGYALAYKALCDAFQVPCEIVTGHLAGEVHAWNLIQLEGSWYHSDAAMAPQGRDRFLGTDEMWFDARYTWDTARYPKCDSEALTAEEVFGRLEGLTPADEPDER